MKKKIFKIIATVLVMIIVFFISLPTLLNKAGLHPDLIVKNIISQIKEQ